MDLLIVGGVSSMYVVLNGDHGDERRLLNEWMIAM